MLVSPLLGSGAGRGVILIYLAFVALALLACLAARASGCGCHQVPAVRGLASTAR